MNKQRLLPPVLLACLALACSDTKDDKGRAAGEEELHATQAAAIRAGDETALQAALNDGGFALVDAAGNITESTAKQKQGTAWDAWDITMMATSIKAGGFMTIHGLADALASELPAANIDTIANAILEEIRTDAVSDVASVRARARLIVALGKASEPPYDLLDASVGTDARLDPVQLGIIVQTLATGILRNTPSSAQAIKAQGARPCTITDIDSFILDADAAISGKGVEKVLEVMEEMGMVTKSVGERLGYINILLTYLKLIWSLMHFDMQVHLSSDDLVRSKDTTDGEEALIFVDARLNLGDAQIINCIRPALTKFGIDASLFNDGPVKGAIVDWEPENFPVSNNGSGECIQFKQGAFGSVPGHAHSTRTDDAGHTEIPMQGRRQARRLPARTQRDPRTATINIILKMKDADLKSDLLDALSLPSAPAEMLYRSGFGTTELFEFGVIDWTDPCKNNPAPDCDVSWVCTIGFSGSGTYSIPASGMNGQNHFEQEDIYSYDASGSFTGKVANLQGAPFTDMTGSGEATLTHSQVFTSVIVDSSCTTTNTSSTSESMTGALGIGQGTNGFFAMTYVDQPGPYQIIVSGLAGTVSGDSHLVGSLTHQGSSCGTGHDTDETHPISEPFTSESLSASGITSVGDDGKLMVISGEQQGTVSAWLVNEVNYAFTWTCQPIQ